MTDPSSEVTSSSVTTKSSSSEVADPDEAPALDPAEVEAEAEEQELAILRSGGIGPAWQARLDRLAAGIFRHLDRSRTYPMFSAAPRSDAMILFRAGLVLCVPVGLTVEVPIDFNYRAKVVLFTLVISFYIYFVISRLMRGPSRRLLRHLREDLKAGVVLNAPATVAVVGGRCVSQVGARPLVMTTRASDALLRFFGAHRAFFLPRCGLVLAIEPEGADGGYRADRRAARRSADLGAMDAVLSRACGFESEWAAENRAGRLAPGQWRALFRGYFSNALEVLVTAALVRTMFVLVARWSDDHDPRFRVMRDHFDTAWIVLFIAVPAIILLQHLIRVAVAIAAGKVRTAEPVTCNDGRWFSSPHSGFFHGFHIRGPAVIRDLNLGRLYRAHYVPGVNLLVGIEVLEARKPPEIST